MFIGHYGLALAAKRAAPRTSLGVLVAAAQLVDLIWPVLLLLGVERVSIVSNPNPFLRLSFDSYPWTHSLVTGIVWGVLAGGAYVAFRHNRTGGLVVGLLVVSHWVLDLIVHTPDLPIYPGGPRVGLGMWRSVPATIVVEAVILVAGVAIYARSTRATNRTGRWAFRAFVAFLVLLFVGNAASSAPPNANVVAWGALGGWLLPLFAWWVDRHRADPRRVTT